MALTLYFSRVSRINGVLSSSQAASIVRAIFLSVLSTLCIVYQVGGVYRAEATGLSCYYSYNGDVNDFNGYANVGAGLAFKHLYAYGLTGELVEGGDEYIASLDIEELPEIITLADKDWDGAPLDVNEEGTSILEL